MKRSALIITLLTFSLGAGAQPPDRDLLPLNAWTLPGYEPLPVEEAFNMPGYISFDSVASMAFNSNGNLIVLHRGQNPFLEFDKEGNFIRAFGQGRYFNRAHGLHIDDEDNLWVTDVANHIVMKFDADGDLLMMLGEMAQSGEWNEEDNSRRFNQPNEVTLDSAGNVYVAQGHGPGEPRVLKFSPDGEFITQWGERGDGPGEFAVAHSIDADAQDRLYVADRENFRVQIFDTEGNFIEEWQYNAMICGVYLHDDGQVWITTGFDGEFAKIDAEGNIIGALGTPGPANGQFGEAHYITVDSDDDAYIADVVNRRVQVYHKHDDSPEPVHMFRR